MKSYMKSQEFNDPAGPALYSYAHSPVHARGFMILRRTDMQEKPQPVGDYTVLEKDEDPSLSEQKMVNVVSALNGKPQLVALGEKTKSRLLYNVISDGSDGGKIRVMFYRYDGRGVSTENALLEIEGVENDRK